MQDHTRTFVERFAKRSNGPNTLEDFQAIEVFPWTQPKDVEWNLPLSKSHLIRWLLMTSQGPENETFKIVGVKHPGEDVMTMRHALSKLGVDIIDSHNSWIVKGVGSNGFKNPHEVIDCANSGTAMRLLTVAVARIGEPIVLDGDESLRKRGHHEYWQELRKIGIDVQSNIENQSLPIVVTGPANSGKISLDVSKTSQHISALLLSMPALDGTLSVQKVGELVSRRHAELSFGIAKLCGSINAIDDCTLRHFYCSPPSEIQVPPDTSHVAFAKLFEIVHGVTTTLPEIDAKDGIGSEILFDLDLSIYNKVDLRDANDLISPLSAAMAIGGGGTIYGASHAQYKESPRISSTVKLLASFGLKATMREDGLEISGGQEPLRPPQLVPTYGDHRMQMTAVILATKTGGIIEGSNLHLVSDPEFLENLAHHGIKIQVC